MSARQAGSTGRGKGSKREGLQGTLTDERVRDVSRGVSGEPRPRDYKQKPSSVAGTLLQLSCLSGGAHQAVG